MKPTNPIAEDMFEKARAAFFETAKTPPKARKESSTQEVAASSSNVRPTGEQMVSTLAKP